MTSKDLKLLVLDLDETLVFASERELDRPADLSVAGYHVYKRPHLDAFLDFAFSTFKVGVWTSSGQLYAEPLVAQLMPGRDVQFVWSAKRCSTARDWETGGYSSQKRLAKLKKRGFKLEHVIGIDDTPSKYAQNYGNLVLVQEFTGDRHDDELARLAAYLEQLSAQPNIRAVEKRNWRDRLKEH
ncbi:NIF family HAD-type phosphatase [Stenotrophomonas sp. PD6]|uniref:NIF family HAD-type phosphatase n=1 Tax=Stenotrophomonas sp. PD6 TaxID=3368612 RepID=UPI003BA09941